MADFPSLGKISSFMEGLVEREGTTPWGVGFPNEENQAIRFAPLLQVVEADEDGFTVNDLGCGFADLYRFIRGQGLPMRGYRGHDLTEKMLDVAKTRVGSDAELVSSDRLDQPADYSFACGIFNTKLDASDAEWMDYMKAVIHNLDENSTRGFAFNSLTSYVDYRESHLFYADPVEVFDYCKREISPRVALLHDYPLWEWTILIRNPERPSGDASRAVAPAH